MRITSPNQPAAANPAKSSGLQFLDPWRGVAEPGRSPNVRAERARPKSWKDEKIIAQGKRSAALGQILKMNTSLFSKLCWPGQHNFEKREIGGGGDVPRAAASAALPWAIIVLPLRGARRSLTEVNQTLDRKTRSAVRLPFQSRRHWRAARHRSAFRSET